jgi:hypothetical protein
MQGLYVLLRKLVDENIGGIGKGGKRGFGIEKKGAVGGLAVRIPGPPKEAGN